MKYHSNYKLLIVEKHITDGEMKKNLGKFYDTSYYTTIITEDTNVYYRNYENKLKLLFCFRKKVIPINHIDDSIKLFKQTAQSVKTNNRGIASGEVDINGIKLTGDILNKGKFRTKIVNNEGKESKYKIANSVNSLLVGYYDKPKRRDKNYTTPCRLTAFTEKNWKDWESIYPLINILDTMYSKYMPINYNEQKKLATINPQYTINNSVFSTMTVNYNWRTACHLDSGDFHNGYSVILVGEQGNYTGGYLGYPQFKVAVDVRNGDFLLKDPHQYHCNTEIEGNDYTRLSMVFYYRENISKC